MLSQEVERETRINDGIQRSEGEEEEKKRRPQS